MVCAALVLNWERFVRRSYVLIIMKIVTMNIKILTPFLKLCQFKLYVPTVQRFNCTAVCHIRMESTPVTCWAPRACRSEKGHHVLGWFCKGDRENPKLWSEIVAWGSTLPSAREFYSMLARI